MLRTSTSSPDTQHRVPARSTRGRGSVLLLGGLVVALVLLSVVAFGSIVFGSRSIGPDTIVQALAAPTAGDPEHIVIRELRIPRTILGVLVGAALGLAGAVMQGTTRNPLADPGILGLNAGASLAVVLGIALLGLHSPAEYVWLAFLGAAGATAVVYGVASFGRDGATPVKLALAGAAVTAALTSVISTVLLLSTRTLNEFRFWEIGSLSGRTMDVVVPLAPFLVIGVCAALLLGPSLNGLALGDDVATALGQHVVRARVAGALVVVLLAGAATAAVGPVAFVGLTVPHLARAVTGPDYRWVLPYSAVLGGVLLLGADLLGRVLTAPGELQVGIMTAVIGAPVLILLVRRTKVSEL